MSLFKHFVSMSVVQREITEVHADYVVVTEYLLPDPKGPFLMMSDHSEAEWAVRKVKEPVTTIPTPACICGKGNTHVFNPDCPHPMHRIRTDAAP